MIASPFSENVTHRTNLGFSCFCKKHKYDLVLFKMNCLYYKTTVVFKLTSNKPCFFKREPFSSDQKQRWDFPHVTIIFASVGWKSAAKIDSLEHCNKNAEKQWLIFVLDTNTGKREIKHYHVF